ncbi:diacylglycerol O-acyltransferase 3 [Impatiens glandulifera]|uniref:diacylglycerol O-acyltransferase 3 n=1 Tax=Impatiens glandulifera TaxID=253017 RepID=UPI001FB097B6|nr:diacylglycerol O-acyltransferase 3 [Impatiens glandulifera]
MEVSGIVSSRPSFFSGEIGPRRTSLHMIRSSSMSVPSFIDEGHVKYYCSGLKLKPISIRGAVKENDSAIKKNMKMMKKRLKLLKGLSKDAAFFSEMEIGFNSNFQQDDESTIDINKGKTVSEATELLLAQLKQLKAEKKELKMKKKNEKAKMLHLDSSSSSSSESSDDERGQVMDMSRLKKALVKGNRKEESQSAIAVTGEIGLLPENCINETSSYYYSSSSLMEAIDDAKIKTLSQKPETKMIEVCMGGKCKKLGAPALMEEFQKTVGVEIAVVGCKCMGKCRTGPNVKVHDVEQRLLVSAAAADEEGEKTVGGGSGHDHQHNHNTLLCTGVGFEDVSVIVSNL